VDTGFNGDGFMAAIDAPSLGVPSIGIRSQAEVAGGVSQQVDEARATMRWMDQERRIELLLGLAATTLRPADDPVALIGTRLMSPHRLTIDFAEAIVEIATFD
jgi:hypothetical protein